MRRRRLSAGEVSEMRRFFDAGHPITDLSAEVPTSTVKVASRICNRKTYVDVPDNLELIAPAPVPVKGLVETVKRSRPGMRR